MIGAFASCNVLALLNNIFALMIDVKMRCHFNNLNFLLKNIIKLTKYEIKYSR